MGKYGKYILDISQSMENGGKMVGYARKNHGKTVVKTIRNGIPSGNL
jgi:hypothetical protein